jgi:tetratricopeptide (TPR) repeat protein
VTQTLRDRYPGPYSFEDTPQDRCIFFGRSPEIELLSQQIIAARLLILFGKSGLGKTSLLQAGVFPHLRDEGLLPIPVRLASSATLMELITDAAQSVSEKFAIDYTPGEMTSLWEFFKTAMFWSGDTLMVPVLVFDQFEEIFTLKDMDFRKAFSREVGTVVSGNPPPKLRARVQTGTQEEQLSDAPPKVKVVMSLREEYLGALQELSRDIPGLFQERFRLLPLSEAHAREAIQRPAQLGPELLGANEVSAFNTLPFEYDPEALQEMVAFLKGRSEAIEPFQLQLLCQHIEKNMPKEPPPGVARITVTPSDLGGRAAMNAVLQQFYRDAMAALPRGQKRRAQELCERGLLTTAGNRLMLQEDQIRSEYRVSEKTLGYLVDQRLLRKELRLESVFYELSHDTLAQSIAQIRHWHIPKKYRLAAVISFVAGLMLMGAGIWFVLTMRAEKERSDQARARAERSEEQVRLALKDTETAQQEVIQNFRQATKIVEDFLTKLNDEKIKNIKGFGPVRKELGEIGLKYYREFTRQRGNDPSVRTWVWHNLGVSFSILNNLDEAIVAYHKQVEITPDHDSAWNGLGIAFADQGKLDDAIAAYHKQLEVKPAHEGAWNNLGNAFTKQGKLDDAIAAYHKQLEVKPAHEWAWNGLGIAFTKQGKLDDAIAAYHKQLEVKPAHEWAWNNLGIVLSKQGHPDEAAAAYAQGLAVQPNDLYLLGNDMELAFVQGDMTRFHARMAALAPQVTPQTELFVLVPFFAWLAHPAQDWRNVMTAIQELASEVTVTWNFRYVLPAITRLDLATQEVAQHFIDFFEGRINRVTLKARLVDK